jgi:hypothetical protein
MSRPLCKTGPEINPFYRLHQLFRLAATELPRYSSLFSMMFVSSQRVETGHFNLLVPVTLYP